MRRIQVHIQRGSKFVVINEHLSDVEKRIVAAHEAGHFILHLDSLKTAPLKENALYDMTSKLEYDANLFTADFLIEDDEVKNLTADEDMDYFNMCRIVKTSPELMSFKLWSMKKRGYHYDMPIPIDSRFLGRGVPANHTFYRQ